MNGIVNGVRREIQIISAPQGSFMIDDGFVFFPFAIALAESGDGRLLSCPLIGDVWKERDIEGSMSVVAAEVFTYLTQETLHEAVDGAMVNLGYDFDEALSYVLEEFKAHRTGMSHWGRKYLHMIKDERRLVPLREFKGKAIIGNIHDNPELLEDGEWK